MVMGEGQRTICNRKKEGMVNKRAVKDTEEIGFVSNMFIIPKNSGGFCPVINLKKLNASIVYRHFKMEDISSVKHLIYRNDWMVKLDFIYRSMLPSTLGPIDGHPFGKHPLILKLMKGIYNSNLPKPKYEHTWDVDIVIKHLNQLKNEDLEIGQLALKLATQLALAAFLRVSELAAIRIEGLVINEEGMTFSLLKPRKAQKKGPLKVFTIKRILDYQVDPVSCAERYLELTEKLRDQSDSKHLFIGSVRPHRPGVGSTVVGWIMSQLQEGGIDKQTFSAHSTRRAATSKAAVMGAPIQSIIRAAYWSSESTFFKFYRRDLYKEPSLAEVVLIL